MRLIFIYDTKELENLGQLIKAVPEKDHVHVHTVNKHLYDVAIEVKNKISGFCIIFVEQYLSCTDEGFEWLQRNAGIALIKFLRMIEVRSHIVLITPFTNKELELIRQSPDNLIITSKGISFTRNLHKFCNKTLEELDKLSKVGFDVNQDLKTYILAEFRLPEDERHNWANWWGIDRLWLAHHVINSEVTQDSIVRSEIEDYPSSLITTIKKLKNYQALYLFGQSEKNFLLKIIDAKKKINELNKALITFGNQKTQSVFLWDEEHVKHSNTIKAIDELKQISTQKGSINKLINNILDFFFKKEDEINELKNKIATEEKHIDEMDHIISNFSREKTKWVNQINNIEQIIAQFKENGLTVLTHVFSLQEEVRKRNPKILYIDDQANEGWSNVFQHIIYGSEKEESFKFIQPDTNDEINEQYFTQVVSPEITKHNPHLILLDLRLKKESGTITNVEKFSGAILLKDIRKQFPGLPILMTTASNKSWSYEGLHRIGCDAFWVKEGIDTVSNEVDTIKNYKRFVELVNTLTGQDYCFLKTYYERIGKLEEKGRTQKHWWQLKNRFKKDELTEIDVNDVYSILKETSIIFREFLHNQILDQTINLIWNEWFYASLIIQNLGKIIELFHFMGAEPNVRTMEYRGDRYGVQLYKKRNEASHIEKVVKLSIQDAKFYMTNILDYLDNKDTSDPTGPKIIGKITLN